MRVMNVVRDVGLPEPPADLDPRARERVREAWLGAIYGLLASNEGAVRVSAMLALERVSDAGIHSLREEDWQDWWLARVPSRPAESGADSNAQRGASLERSTEAGGVVSGSSSR